MRRALADLARIVAAVEERDIQARLHIDLGEVRGFDYYTGLRFQGYAEGAGQAVLGGGRYDDLLGRYGRPSPAVGFAVDVEVVAAALEAAQAAHAPGNGTTSRNGNGAFATNGAANGGQGPFWWPVPPARRSATLMSSGPPASGSRSIWSAYRPAPSIPTPGAGGSPKSSA